MFGDPLCGAVQPAIGPLGLPYKLAVRNGEVQAARELSGSGKFMPAWGAAGAEV
jgi:hypothetical protein